MYHSHLLINVGDNPDRPDYNVCRRWLRNLYRVHQRLCMAFPSSAPVLIDETNDDADVHQPQPRNQDAGFLFRIDHPVDAERGCRRPVIIVQSATAPDWNKAFGLTKSANDDRGRPVGNAAFLLAAPPQRKPASISVDGDVLALNSEKQDYRIRCGEIVRFRLRANPTRKVQDGSHNGKRQRINPTPKDHADWLERKLATAVDGTLRLENFVTGWSYGWRSKYEPQPSQRMQWWSVLFEGSFRMKDPAVLRTLLESGIGPAKAFGFGLLSVAPVR